MFVGAGEAADLVVAASQTVTGRTSIFILPTVSRFIRQAGWAPTIIQNYLTLRNAHESIFLPKSLRTRFWRHCQSMPDPGSRWRGTQIAARIEGRECRFLQITRLFYRSILPWDRSSWPDPEISLLIRGDRRRAALQISPAFRVGVCPRPPQWRRERADRSGSVSASASGFLTIEGYG